MNSTSTTATAPLEYVPRLTPTNDWPWKSMALAGMLEVLLLFKVNIPIVTELGGFLASPRTSDPIDLRQIRVAHRPARPVPSSTAWPPPFLA